MLRQKTCETLREALRTLLSEWARELSYLLVIVACGVLVIFAGYVFTVWFGVTWRALVYGALALLALSFVMALVALSNRASNRVSSQKHAAEARSEESEER